MKTQTVIRISRMILLTIVVSLAMLAFVYALQQPQAALTLAIVCWNI
jgi:hypothetical protein